MIPELGTLALVLALLLAAAQAFFGLVGPWRNRQSWMAAVTPAAAIARALASRACPSTRPRTTGLSGTARLSASCTGNRVSGQAFWFHPRPLIHSPAVSSRARAATRWMTSS